VKGEQVLEARRFEDSLNPKEVLRLSKSGRPAFVPCKAISAPRMRGRCRRWQRVHV